jgi:Protein of unknown function (DUF2510)/Protein of unknown function (DUF3592)
VDGEQFGFSLMWAAIVMIVGVLFVVHERMTHRRVARLGRVGRRASAVVVDYEYRRDLDGDPVPYPLVRFQTPDGRVVTAETDFGGSLVPSIGDQVAVLYDPHRPEEAHLDSQLADRLIILIGRIGRGLIGVGALTVIIALLIFWPAAGVVVLMVGGVVLAIVLAARRIPAHRPSPTPATLASGWSQGAAPAGWFPDPSRRHELRYWDGQHWTEHVFNRGAQSVDPV